MNLLQNQHVWTFNLQKQSVLISKKNLRKLQKIFYVKLNLCKSSITNQGVAVYY